MQVTVHLLYNILIQVLLTMIRLWSFLYCRSMSNYTQHSSPVFYSATSFLVRLTTVRLTSCECMLNRVVRVLNLSLRKWSRGCTASKEQYVFLEPMLSYRDSAHASSMWTINSLLMYTPSLGLSNISMVLYGFKSSRLSRSCVCLCKENIVQYENVNVIFWCNICISWTMLEGFFFKIVSIQFDKKNC